MRILIVSEVFWPEDFIINDLAQEWNRMGHTVEVVTQYPSYPGSYTYEGYKNKGTQDEDWDGITIHRFPFIEGYKTSKAKKFANYLDFIVGGKRRAKALGPNFDCVFVSQTGPLTVALPAIAMKKKYGIPVYIWTCDIWPDVLYSYGVPQNKLTEPFINRLIRKIYRNCDKIFVSSEKFKETISQYIEPAKDNENSKELIYAPNWLRPAKEEKSDINLDKTKINFTFTGNISLYQNMPNVVRGFIKADIKDSVLNIIGDGSDFEAVKSVVEESNSSNVILYGRRPYSQMNDILSQSDVLVLPLIPQPGIEKTEPFKIQSYLYAGKPILGIIRGSGKEIIEQNQVGVCADPSSIESIAKGFISAKQFAQTSAESVKMHSEELMKGRFNRKEIVNLITKSII